MEPPFTKWLGIETIGARLRLRRPSFHRSSYLREDKAQLSRRGMERTFEIFLNRQGCLNRHRWIDTSVRG